MNKIDMSTNRRTALFHVVVHFSVGYPLEGILNAWKKLIKAPAMHK
mgnify:CR=1 FL=1